MDDQEKLALAKGSDEESKTAEVAVSSEEEEGEEEEDGSAGSAALDGRVAIVRGPNGQQHRIPISVLLRLMQGRHTGADDDEEGEAEAEEESGTG